MKVNNPPWKQLSWSYYGGAFLRPCKQWAIVGNSGGSYFGCLRWLKFWLALFAVKGWKSFRWLTLHQGECKKVANTSATGLSKFCSRIYLLRWMQDIVVWAWEAACVLATEDDINELSKFLSVDKVTNLWVPFQSRYRLLCSFCHRAQVCTSFLFYVIMCVPGFSFQYDIRKCKFFIHYVACVRSEVIVHQLQTCKSSPFAHGVMHSSAKSCSLQQASHIMISVPPSFDL